MFRFINRIINRQYYDDFIKKLDKQSGIPQSASDWRVRAITCEVIIKKLDNDKRKIIALHRIKQESEEMANQIESQKKSEYLSGFSGIEGCEKYIQVGGRDFAQEIWFYKDKSKITVITDNGSVDYNMIANPGKWYQHNLEGVNYGITLGTKSPEKILISINDGKEYDSFTIDLVPKS
ncbi:hypothetical protein [Echinicola rosea]|uniref:Uncharacterized protein n=1 Tax=Echinicola rosea TaxID=1807691 RepID=A0ABQ1VCM6_9BACT|nr:hypothetical protein [Echinicola rosea]GGF49097.1 hypothetical protein GCM10011339_42150 [Echinicola rosea]